MIFSKFIKKRHREKTAAEKELERIKIFQKYNGRCAYCGCKLEYKDMEISQLPKRNSFFREPVIQKTLPACESCYFQAGAFSLEEFRTQIDTTILEYLREDTIYKLAIKYGVIKEMDPPYVFYFEKIDAEKEKEAI